MLLARKANLLRILARWGTKQTPGGFEEGEAPETKRACLVSGEAAEALLFSPVRMAGNLRERANEACKKVMNKHKQPVGLMAYLRWR
jgi:hypothetical protein